MQTQKTKPVNLNKPTQYQEPKFKVSPGQKFGCATPLLFGTISLISYLASDDASPALIMLGLGIITGLVSSVWVGASIEQFETEHGLGIKEIHDLTYDQKLDLKGELVEARLGKTLILETIGSPSYGDSAKLCLTAEQFTRLKGILRRHYSLPESTKINWATNGLIDKSIKFYVFKNGQRQVLVEFNYHRR